MTFAAGRIHGLLGRNGAGKTTLLSVIGLASRAPVTILDEVHLGMDAPTRQLLIDLLLADLAEVPRTVILSSHLIDEIGHLLETVTILHKGKVLLAEEADDVRRRGVTITGPAARVDEVCRGLTVVGTRDLGPTRQVTAYGELSGSTVEAAERAGLVVGAPPQGAAWFVFGTAVYFATVWLGPMVSAGATRRTVERAGLVAAPALGLTGALAWMLVSHAEHWIFGRLGWAHGVDGRRLSILDVPALTYLAAFALTITIAAVCGSLVGVTYFRWGAWATVLLPLTLLPLVACALLGVDSSIVFPPFLLDLGNALRPDGNAFGLLARLGFGLVILAQTAGAHHALIRRVPVRSTKA